VRTPLLTLKEAADRLRIDPESVRLLIKAGEIRAIKAGPGLTSPWRISERALADYLRKQYAQSRQSVS